MAVGVGDGFGGSGVGVGVGVGKPGRGPIGVDAGPGPTGDGAGPGPIGEELGVAKLAPEVPSPMGDAAVGDVSGTWRGWHAAISTGNIKSTDVSAFAFFIPYPRHKSLRLTQRNQRIYAGTSFGRLSSDQP